jgi:hypothetical protein
MRRTIAAHLAKKDHIMILEFSHPVTRHTGVLDPVQNREAFTAAREHFRHERQPIEPAFLVKAGADLGETAHLYPVPGKEMRLARRRLSDVRGVHVASLRESECARRLPLDW